jgi:transposase InsO family protein
VIRTVIEVAGRASSVSGQVHGQRAGSLSADVGAAEKSAGEEEWRAVSRPTKTSAYHAPRPPAARPTAISVARSNAPSPAGSTDASKPRPEPPPCRTPLDKQSVQRAAAPVPFPRAPTSAGTAPATSTRSPQPSTPDPARPSAGEPRPKSSTMIYPRSGSAELHRPLEPGQYTSAEFATFCVDKGLCTSVGRTGACWDNAAAESFFATLKNEMYYRQRFDTRAKARFAVAEYIEISYKRKTATFQPRLPHPRRNPRRPPGPPRGLTTTTTRNCPTSLTQPTSSLEMLTGCWVDDGARARSSEPSLHARGPCPLPVCRLIGSW